MPPQIHRPRPIAHAPDKAVLYRIDVTIFNVAPIILIIPDQVLPEATLPYTSFAALPTDLAQPLGLWYRLREGDLDESPSHRKIGIVRRQSPDGVNVIGQDDECVDAKWMPLPRAVRCLA